MKKLIFISALFIFTFQVNAQTFAQTFVQTWDSINTKFEIIEKTVITNGDTILDPEKGIISYLESSPCVCFPNDTFFIGLRFQIVSKDSPPGDTLNWESYPANLTKMINGMNPRRVDPYNRYSFFVTREDEYVYFNILLTQRYINSAEKKEIKTIYKTIQIF